MARKKKSKGNKISRQWEEYEEARKEDREEMLLTLEIDPRKYLYHFYQNSRG